MPDEVDAEIRSFGSSTVLYCRAFAPAYLLVWHGVTTLEGAEWGLGLIMDDILAEHRAGRRAAMLSDAIGVQGTTADVRKFFAAKNDEIPVDALFANLVILDSAVVRGIMKAISWITPSLSSKPVGTAHDAVRITVEAMRAEGIEPPDGFRAAAIRQLRTRTKNAAPG
ncbi:MAG: hypothetical protein AB8I08_18400 [Sandaracinaceae bacterium]